MSSIPESTRLKRSISLPLLIAYGVGTMVGAGFYALLGRVAHHSGMQTPCAFLLAAGVAFISGLSFSELASRFPVSSGESRYVQEGFQLRWLSMLVGWAVIATGIVSAATLTRAFVGFTQDLVNVPTVVVVVAFVAALTLIAIRGILESVWFTATITLIEVGGLLWVLVANGRYLGDLADRWGELVPDASWGPWSGITIGAFLAFYAFIGFEDMVNEAEEVANPRVNLPRGIMAALILTSVLYLMISVTAVLAFRPEELAASRTPLSLLVSQHGDVARTLMTYISMLAGINGALVQLIMASRVVYGMSDHGIGPRVLAVVHPRYRTPVRATLVASVCILAFALWLPLESLARVTSSIMLINFAAVNASLVRIKLRDQVPHETKICPIWVPALGCCLCLLMLAVQFVVQS